MHKLHWTKVGAGRWESQEGRPDSKKRTVWHPDFVITYGGGYRLKIQSARQLLWFDTLQEAKDYAESV